MGQPSSGGEVAFSPGGYLYAEQFGQHLRIGQLPTGGGVKGIVQDLHGLLEAQGFQVLARLFQSDHATPAAASSYTSRERRSTSPVGICTATASFRGRLSPFLPQVGQPTGQILGRVVKALYRTLGYRHVQTGFAYVNARYDYHHRTSRCNNDGVLHTCRCGPQARVSVRDDNRGGRDVQL